MPDPTTLTGLVSTVIGGALLVALVGLWRLLKPRLDRLLGQTENQHADTPYPNLRDELTAVRLAAEAAADNSVQTRRELEGLREDHRELSRRVDHHIQNVAVAPEEANHRPVKWRGEH